MKTQLRRITTTNGVEVNVARTFASAQLKHLFE